MKKLIFISCLLFIGTNISAQSSLSIKRVELATGLYSTNEDFLPEINDPYYLYNYPTSDFPWGQNESLSATFFAGFSFFEYKRLEVGIDFGFQHLDNQKSIDNYHYEYGDSIAMDRTQINVFSFMPELRMNWIRSSDDLFEMYSSVNFGLSFLDIRETNPTKPQKDSFYPVPNIHLTGLGIRFGDELGGFLELGVGAKGLMSAGISYRPD